MPCKGLHCSGRMEPTPVFFSHSQMFFRCARRTRCARNLHGRALRYSRTFSLSLSLVMMTMTTVVRSGAARDLGRLPRNSIWPMAILCRMSQSRCVLLKPGGGREGKVSQSQSWIRGLPTGFAKFHGYDVHLSIWTATTQVDIGVIRRGTARCARQLRRALALMVGAMTVLRPALQFSPREARFSRPMSLLSMMSYRGHVPRGA